MRKARTEKENAIREKMLSELYANEYNKSQLPITCSQYGIYILRMYETQNR